MSKFKKYIPMITAILMVAIGLLLSFKQEPQKQYSCSFIDVFDTVIQIIGYDESQEDFNQKANTLKEKLQYYHKLYDIYTSYEGINNLYTINQNAGIAPVEVDQAIIELLKFSIQLHKETNGQINIAMGSVLEIWHDYRTHGINRPADAELPPMNLLTEAATHIDISKIIIDENESTVYLSDSEMSIDVGSIGKGYAVQMVSEYARELGYDNMIINAGGNVSVIGERIDGSLWKLGIQNPDLTAENIVLKTVAVKDKCLVTSGDYQRYYVVDGIEYCHIIDPDTLMPANYYRSVSILTEDSGMADALSTAVFNMEFEEGLALINSLKDTEAIWIFEDGTIKYSDNFEQFLVEE